MSLATFFSQRKHNSLERISPRNQHKILRARYYSIFGTPYYSYAKKVTHSHSRMYFDNGLMRLFHSLQLTYRKGMFLINGHHNAEPMYKKSICAKYERAANERKGADS